MTTRVCSVCKKEKPLSAFHLSVYHTKGHVYRCKECACKFGKDYRKEHQKEINKRKTRCLIELKQNGCAICGYTQCYKCLDFHHVNPEDKKFHLTHPNMSRTDTSIIEEVQKCILLCKNCHCEIHYKLKEK